MLGQHRFHLAQDLYIGQAKLLVSFSESRVNVVSISDIPFAPWKGHLAYRLKMSMGSLCRNQMRYNRIGRGLDQAFRGLEGKPPCVDRF